ncbi:MAG: hypothetical protein OEV37_01860 [Candidatus Berkelbacteria bacterium]|nr:hypothetical protein [Candidatus Berkelbacteria bacterium]
MGSRAFVYAWMEVDGGQGDPRRLSREALIGKIEAGEKGWAVVSYFLPGGDELRATLSLTIARSDDAGVGLVRIAPGDTAQFPIGRVIVPRDSLELFVGLAEAELAKACQTVEGRTLPSEEELAPVGADAA